MFLSYLWGMETLYRDNFAKGIRKCSYPTYEEWKRFKKCSWYLPLRGSYPTYEEWKLPQNQKEEITETMFLSYLWGMETKIAKIVSDTKLEIVLILPMRNGNKLKNKGGSKLIDKFLSYLWGMETVPV